MTVYKLNNQCNSSQYFFFELDNNVHLSESNRLQTSKTSKSQNDQCAKECEIVSLKGSNVVGVSCVVICACQSCRVCEGQRADFMLLLAAL